MTNKECNFLKRFRKIRNITQKELAEKLNYSLATIKTYEKKKLSKKFKIKLLEKFKLSEIERTELGIEYNECLLENIESLKVKEEYLNEYENKLKKEKIKLEKEKFLLKLEQNKSDYLKIKDILSTLNITIHELDVQTTLSLNIKEISKKELKIIIEKNILELEKIVKRFNNKIKGCGIYDIE
ncbi:MAG: helix-turn-helix transcriptional regulator [Cetobacterium sp.]|nr:helix-turn-helix transcriptional regulator [Cetobacterium sp.]